MFTINDDLSIYVTRGDALWFSVTAQDKDAEDLHVFVPGDVVRLKVYERKNAEKVVLQCDFPIVDETDHAEIFLDKEDTKIGKVISKPTDYWYEVELNPETPHAQTIIGYDDAGAKVFKLFPEGADLESYVPDPEDIPIVDDELDLTSTRPVQNQAVTRGILLAKHSAWEVIYPVGSVYITVLDANPAELFGGDWEQRDNTLGVHLWVRTA